GVATTPAEHARRRPEGNRLPLWSSGCGTSRRCAAVKSAPSTSFQTELDCSADAAAGTSVNSNRDSERVFAQNGRTEGEMDREVALSCDGIFALSRGKREKIERAVG